MTRPVPCHNYPVNDERNNALTDAYRKLAHQEGVMFPEDINTLPTGEGTGGALSLVVVWQNTSIMIWRQ